MDFEPHRHSTDPVRTNDNYTGTITGAFETPRKPFSDALMYTARRAVVRKMRLEYIQVHLVIMICTLGR